MSAASPAGEVAELWPNHSAVEPPEPGAAGYLGSHLHGRRCVEPSFQSKTRRGREPCAVLAEERERWI
jgi:hypothetical protein